MAWLGGLTPDDPAIDDLNQLAGVFRNARYMSRVICGAYAAAL